VNGCRRSCTLVLVSERARERLANAPYFSGVKHESFDGADLVSVLLDRLRFDRCTLVAADMRQATLDNCWFKFCDLRSARLRGASLRFARFAGCDLRGADLRDCDLTGAHFGFVMTGAETGRTDLTSARTEGATLDGAVFEQVTGWRPR
jgi:uncharacterized protein YjbI with pentapeptide repeats